MASVQNACACAPRLGADHPGRRLAHDQPAHHDGEHAGGVDRLGEQERGERGQDHGDVARAAGRPGGGAPAPRPSRPPRRPRPRRRRRAGTASPTCSRAELLLADRDADRQPVDDQRGAVVDQALGAQHGDAAARQRPGEHARPRSRRSGRRAAPSTQAGPHGRPSACATTATAAAVAMTRTVLIRTMPRRLVRISRSEVVRLSQYSSAGRKSSSTTSGGRCTCAQCGHEAEQRPDGQQQDRRGDPEPVAHHPRRPAPPRRAARRVRDRAR